MSNPINNNNLLNDHIIIKYEDGLKGTINTSTDTTKNTISLGKSVTMSITDNALNAIKLVDASVTNTKLENSSITINTSGTLSGGSEVSLGDSITLEGTTKVLQMISSTNTSMTTHTTATPALDDTIPQITEGDEFQTLSITPKSASSTLYISVTVPFSTTAAGTTIISLFQDSTADALAAKAVTGTSGWLDSITFQHVVASENILKRTYKLRIGTQTGTTTTINGAVSARKLGGVVASTIIITEVEA